VKCDNPLSVTRHSLFSYNPERKGWISSGKPDLKWHMKNYELMTVEELIQQLKSLEAREDKSSPEE
jgi:hypothetical protein